MKSKRIWGAVAVAFAVCLAAVPAVPGSTYWQAGIGAWENPDNWTAVLEQESLQLGGDLSVQLFHGGKEARVS